MLGRANAIPTIGVKDLEAARKFYETKLGLTPTGESNEFVQLYKSGDSTIEIYKSDYAGTNKATAMTWTVGEDIDNDVQTLKQKGVTFEHYQMPGSKLEGDVHVMKDMKMAWFKDPDGNILCIHNH